VSIFAVPDIEVQRRDDGTTILRSRTPLGPYEMNAGAVLARWAALTPDAPFLCERDRDGDWRRVTYADAWTSALAIGQGLLDRGLGPERPAMILSGNSVDHGLLMLGCYVAGIPVVPVSVAYSLQSTDFAKLGRAAAITKPGLVYVSDRAPFTAALDALGVPERDVAASLDEIAATPTDAVWEAYRRVGAETVAKILFTSGSTGLPKGVVNTHGMLCANQQMAGLVWPFVTREPMVLVDWLPWSHTFGGNHNFNLVLWSGGAMYIDSGRPLPGLLAPTLANLRDVSPTAYFNVPAGFAALVPHLEADEDLAATFFARLRLIMYAAAALTPELWDRVSALARRTHGADVALTTAWGCTETAPLATAAHFDLDGPGCIGVPAPGVSLKLAPGGRKLELRVRGLNVFPGYLGDPALSAEAFDEDGFYRTGDAGRFLDPDHPERGVVFDGRVAEDFKLDTGTWVSVGPLRTALVDAAGGTIRDAVITGHDQPCVGALVWLGPGATDDQLRVAVEKHNSAHGQSSTRIRRVLVLAEPPSIDHDEITDKGYINQRAVREHRTADVERLHRETADADVLRFD
jgi:feruloyl-CoA synthase